jgi:hypothetical protein
MVTSFVIFKFKSCPNDISPLNTFGFGLKSGLRYINNERSFQDVKIDEGEQCVKSNVGQMGVWVIELNLRTIYKGIDQF